MTTVAESQCLHELFEAQVDVRPDALALLCRDVRWTYLELEHKANQLARHLRGLEVGPGDLVGVYFDRSDMPILSVLAILKAGAGYIPLDPSYPPERLKHIFDESGMRVLVTETAFAEHARSVFTGTVLNIQESAEAIAKEDITRLTRDDTGVTPQDITYVLYTSGTTGKPKGVTPEHHNVVGFVLSFNEVIQLTSEDRVYQGFSLGFDGSVEEMWMAFSNGARLVVGPPDVIRLPAETEKLFEREGITVFSTVPTFLAMFEELAPSLRLIIVSGEVCPPELVKKVYRPSLRMLNVYGPTEATVNTTAKECLPDQPITIGKTIPNYEAYIFDESMALVPDGEKGELYVGGVGIARGYFHQPELTAKQFLPNPLDGGKTRIYKTGDLVRLNEEGELEFFGRIDRQVKLRGYRIELSEIESVLREFPDVKHAVVDVYEESDHLKHLAAYVIAHDADAFDHDGLLAFLKSKVPPYMVPSYLDLLDDFPRLSSGKINRKALPAPVEHLVQLERDIIEADNELEQILVDEWESLLHISPVSTEDHFFTDLGGYSLLAAQFVTKLRNEHGIELAIREIYQNPTIKQLSVLIAERGDVSEDLPKKPLASEVYASVPGWQKALCFGVQGLFTLSTYALFSVPFLVLALVIAGMVKGALSITTVALALVALAFLAYPTALVLSIVLKWLIIGRFKPGSYPLWGTYYLRWWLATRFQSMGGLGILSGTPVLSLYFRLMGAKIGKNCILDSAACVTYDLVTIGDDSSIGSETQFLGYRVEDGMLHIGTTSIGSRCFVGTHSAIGLNATMEDDTYLDDLSLLPDGAVIPAGEGWRGSPARKADVVLPSISDEMANERHPLLYGFYHFLLLEVLSMVMILTAIPGFALLLGGYVWGGVTGLLLLLVPAAPFSLITFCLLSAGIKRILLPKVEPGVYKLESNFFLRKWLVDMLMTISRGYVHNLYTTIYLPPWLRLMGAKIGKRAEISTVSQMTPDLTIIEDESFFADGSMVGGRRIFRGHVHLAFNRIGRRSFVGNNAILPIGAGLGDGCLLGVLSCPPDGIGHTTPDESEWLGSPSFQLPHRVKVEGFSLEETFEPSTRLYVLRYLIDAMRIFLPGLIGLSAFVAFVAYIIWGFFKMSLTILLLTAIPVSWLLTIMVLGSVIVIKKLLMGRFEPVHKPLWSVYIWFNEVVNGVYETIATPFLLPLMGTPFCNWYLRLLGCDIGKHVYMGTTLFSEFDLVHVGDYAALNAGVVVQNHLFEDRIMKSDHLTIGENCSVGNMAVILYNTEMKSGACVGPLSLLMKGEVLPAQSRWLGIPTSRVQ